ncbi:MAG TPA: hypothetical protein VLG46_09100, partial [Anaerolineae bacterium]|nr:hypothetical protein [Anaerolineae bacterium]
RPNTHRGELIDCRARPAARRDLTNTQHRTIVIVCLIAASLSLGGEMTYRLAARRLETFAAIAPLSTSVHSLPPLERIKDLPVWAIHGAADKISPLAMAQKPVDAWGQAGSNVRFTILPDHDHDTWTDTYSDPRFYEWLLQHQRSEIKR